MKYAVEVANAGSLNKASEELSIAPPNLSRSIKELETDLGIIIFDRSPKGMTLTSKGEEFVHYAKQVLGQINDIERNFRDGLPEKKQFSISVPRASYIADAFVRFSKSIGDEPVEIYYKETNPYRVIKNIIEVDYRLGIIRYASGYDKYFSETLEEKGLRHELITNFRYVLIMSNESPLASKAEIHFSDIHDFIEIAHGDPFVPSLPFAIVKRAEFPDEVKRRIYVFERCSQFELLSENPETFMWVSPVPEKTLERYGLVQRECADNRKVYKDVLLYRNSYTLSELDKRFISELHKSRQKFLAP